MGYGWSWDRLLRDLPSRCAGSSNASAGSANACYCRATASATTAATRVTGGAGVGW